MNKKLNIYGIRPVLELIESGKQIGDLKKLIKDAILDGLVQNNKQDALIFLEKKAIELNIEKK